MPEFVTAESVAQLREKLAVLPTLLEIRMASWHTSILCRDTLGNLPDDMRYNLHRVFVLPVDAKTGEYGLSCVGDNSALECDRFNAHDELQTGGGYQLRV